jgi:AMP nucleosidase
MQKNDINQIVAEVDDLYNLAVERLRMALSEYLDTRKAPSKEQRKAGDFAYPELVIHYSGIERSAEANLAFGKLERPGVYSSTITRPQLFGKYLKSQLKLLDQQYEIGIEVRRSAQEIPFPYVIDAGKGIELGDVTPQELARHFPTTELAHIGDETADGLFASVNDNEYPISLFDALRTDFSLARLTHYTGTAPEHVQRYVLFTNYHRYCRVGMPAGRQWPIQGFIRLRRALC